MTTSERFYSTEGIVVRLNDLGESDRIVSLLTPQRGLVRGVAKSARRPNSKLGGHLDLLRHVTISARTGRSLDSISQAQTMNDFRIIQEDLGRISCGIYLCELSEKFSLEGVPSNNTFEILRYGLGWLERTSNPELFLRWYEMRILQLNGFQPEIFICTGCGITLEQESQTFSATLGGFICKVCRPTANDRLLLASVGVIKILRFLQNTECEALENLRVGEGDRHHVGQILRKHIQGVLDRSVRSTDFLDEINKWPLAST